MKFLARKGFGKSVGRDPSNATSRNPVSLLEELGLRLPKGTHGQTASQTATPYSDFHLVLRRTVFLDLSWNKQAIRRNVITGWRDVTRPLPLRRLVSPIFSLSLSLSRHEAFLAINPNTTDRFFLFLFINIYRPIVGHAKPVTHFTNPSPLARIVLANKVTRVSNFPMFIRKLSAALSYIFLCPRRPSVCVPCPRDVVCLKSTGALRQTNNRFRVSPRKRRGTK